MRVLVLSVATGSCVFFQDLGQPPHGDPSALEGGAELAAKLHRMNALLLEAKGQLPDAASTSLRQPGTPGHAAGSDTHLLLGAGARRLGGSGRPAAGPLLAMRHWQQDQEAWHFADDVDCAVVVAICVPAAWAPDTAAQLVKGFRDSFVQRHRPQLLALASASAALSGPAGAVSLRLDPEAVRQLLVLQALRLLRKLASDAEYGLRQLQPSWLFFAHVPSFMGAYRPAALPATPSSAAGGGGGPFGTDPSAAAPGPASAAADGGGGPKKRRKSLLKSVLSMLGGREGSGGKVMAGDAAGQQQQQQPVSNSAVAAGEPGPVGQLQHLLVCDPEQTAAAAGGGGGGGAAAAAAMQWDPVAIAAAVLQVKPPEGEGDGGGGRAAAGPGGPGGGQQQFPELEDVELEMELQAPGSAGSAPQASPSSSSRLFTVVGMRQQHALVVVAMPSSSAGAADGGAGKSSRVRYELGPGIMVPMSSLFDLLARHASQQEVASSQLLLRLLE